MADELTRVSLPSQKTMYNFKLVVGYTTKHMTAPECDIFNRGASYFNVARTTVHHLYNVKCCADSFRLFRCIFIAFV